MDSDPDIHVGDVVQLLSGGPLMTVVARKEKGTLLCAWFGSDTNKPPSQFGFPPGLLLLKQRGKVYYNVV